MRDIKTLESKAATTTNIKHIIFGYSNQPLSCTKSRRVLLLLSMLPKKFNSNKYYVCYPFMIHRKILLLYYSVHEEHVVYHKVVTTRLLLLLLLVVVGWKEIFSE